jgi:hypothetical protein
MAPSDGCITANDQVMITGFLQPSTTGWMTQLLAGSVVLPLSTAPSAPLCVRGQRYWHLRVCALNTMTDFVKMGDRRPGHA